MPLLASIFHTSPVKLIARRAKLPCRTPDAGDPGLCRQYYRTTGAFQLDTFVIKLLEPIKEITYTEYRPLYRIIQTE